MISTGLTGLDEIITGLRKGDNVVWQIDDIEDYDSLVKPFAKSALKNNKKLIYMRFASHKPLLKPSSRVKVYNLNAYEGFETFATQVNKIITQEGVGVYYVFDCLSALLSAWATDLMIGNFFMVTCPHLYELDTIAYFSIFRNNHSFKSIARIRETTQLLMDIYRCDDSFYIHPLKVWNRYSPTMFLPHLKEKDTFVPVTDSVNASKLLSCIKQKGAQGVKRNLDYWDRLFMEAEDLIKKPVSAKAKSAMLKKLSSVMLTKNKKILSLVGNNFSLEDIVEIKSRLIGTGFIGGKSTGMLLARKILSKDSSLGWQKMSEAHDSFYIGSDFFYSYIIQNNWWKLLMEHKTKEGYFPAAGIMKEKMLYGAFPDEIMEQFQQLIEYFGASPIIVRSSSLLEDGFGNAFAGKYESIFCANQGTPEQRYLAFAEAVKRIYASAMGEDALAYRKQRGLDRLDEQMALLVQRVSGSYHKKYFFPDVAGVGISYNTYVWTDKIKPESGMVRLVFGLGTRAVNRIEGGYARIAALDEPLLKPYSDMRDVRKFSQHEVDVINIKDNALQTLPLAQLVSEKLNLNLDYIAIRDTESEKTMQERGAQEKEYWILTFDELLQRPEFMDSFREILKKLEKNYQFPVEIEFTVNFTKRGAFKINLLQCRPVQAAGTGKPVDMPKKVSRENLVFQSEGYFLGGNISQAISRIIYVKPQRYTELTLSERYDVARIIGSINRGIKDKNETPVLLLGPGRWGTTTPSLGVPVTFAEINNIAVLGEIAFSGANLMPELSFGTHFFQDLIETSIFYIALFPEKENVYVNTAWLDSLKNSFNDMVVNKSNYKDVIGVYNVEGKNVRLMSDLLTQKIMCIHG